MKYLSSTIFFVHNFTLKITSARALIKTRLNKGPAVSKVEKNKGLGYKTSKYDVYPRLVHSPENTANVPLAKTLCQYFNAKQKFHILETPPRGKTWIASFLLF